jgi:hypothetical protein
MRKRIRKEEVEEGKREREKERETIEGKVKCGSEVKEKKRGRKYGMKQRAWKEIKSR